MLDMNALSHRCPPVLNIESAHLIVDVVESQRLDEAEAAFQELHVEQRTEEATVLDVMRAGASVEQRKFADAMQRRRLLPRRGATGTDNVRDELMIKTSQENGSGNRKRKSEPARIESRVGSEGIRSSNS
jgi:hypothetical protein